MHLSRHLRISFIGLGTYLLFINLAPVGASSANISHSFQSTKSIPTGSLVSIDPKTSDYVIASNTNNAARVFGVAVNSSDSLLAVDATKGAVQVATSGTATALVSDVNGPIKVGDQIAVSPFDGIGMKATSGTKIIGLAQSAFDTSASGVEKRTVKNISGQSKDIAIGSLRVNISPGSASGGADDSANGLQKLVRTVTGKTIPTVRIIVALVITIVTLIALIALIYGSVYSTIISVGRNPLAKYAIYRSMGSVLAMAAITAIVALGVVVLLLR
jgi:hypothetical protein